MKINIIIPIVAFELIKFSCGYPSKGWSDVWNGAVWDEPACQHKCQAWNVKATGWPGDKWKKGSFHCGSWEDEMKFPWSHWCKCWDCQRDCTLAEVNYDVEQCEFDPIDYEENNLAPALWDVYEDLKANLAGAIPAVGGLAAAAMHAKNGIFRAIEDHRDGNPLFDAIQEHTKKNNQQMVKCMDQKITEVKWKNIGDIMQGACLLYGDAAVFEVKEDLSNADDKMDLLRNAWQEFKTTVNTRFDNVEHDAQYYKSLLLPLQDFVKAYELLSVDYLLYMYQFESETNYKNAFASTITSIDVLLVWIRRAKFMIMDVDMRGRMRKLACRNGWEIEEEVRAWENQFDTNNVKSILKFMGDLHHLNRILGVTMDMPRKSTASPCSMTVTFNDFVIVASIPGINFDFSQPFILESVGDCTEAKVCTLQVLSIDHEHYGDGMYFHFDKSALDAILGRSDWHNEKLEIGNGQAVRVWRNPKGGSEGDAHGRIEPFANKKSTDWSIGDQITFADCQIKA